MKLQEVILQTFEMMGFTVIVGIVVAFLILGLTKLLSRFDSSEVQH